MQISGRYTPTLEDRLISMAAQETSRVRGLRQDDADADHGRVRRAQFVRRSRDFALAGFARRGDPAQRSVAS